MRGGVGAGQAAYIRDEESFGLCGVVSRIDRIMSVKKLHIACCTRGREHLVMSIQVEVELGTEHRPVWGSTNTIDGTNNYRVVRHPGVAKAGVEFVGVRHLERRYGTRRHRGGDERLVCSGEVDKTLLTKAVVGNFGAGGWHKIYSTRRGATKRG